MQLAVELIAHQVRRVTSKKDQKQYLFHTADVRFQMSDRDGNVGDAVAEVRLPDEAPLTLDRGMYVLDVQPYKAREGGMAFAVRAIAPAAKKAA